MSDSRAQISAVTLVVPEYEAGISFYVGTLGWTLLENIALDAAKRRVTAAPPGGGCALWLAQATGAHPAAAGG